MKVTDLRIGNRARIPAFTEFVEVELSIDNIKDFHQGLIEIKPIPLTEEWLVKFGFSISRCVESVFYDSDFWRIERKIGSNEFKIKHLEVRFKYVHQLQNLYFALKGQEMEIKIQREKDLL